MALDFSRNPSGFNGGQKKRDFDALKAALASRAEEVCRYLLPNGRREGHEWRIGSTMGEPGASMGIHLTGEKAGVWSDFAGQAGGANLVELWMRCQGVDAKTAYDEASELIGFERPTPKPASVSWWNNRAAEPPPPQTTPQPDRVHAGEWDYTTADGEVWATVDRWNLPNGKKEVRPRSALPAGPRPLYNLPAILKSTGPVILVEGEKCAKHLNDRGHIATTNIGGSSGVKPTNWSPLKGREVVRWRDNDKPGEKWAADTQACLQAAGARSVRDVAVPAGKPDKWDCADATDAEIVQLIATAGQAPAVKQVIEATPYRPPAFDKIPKRRFVYDHVYQRGTVTVTAGEGGTGKSALHIVEALAIASGRDLLGTGKPIERCKVWMIALEDDRSEMDRRIAAAMIHFEIEWPDLDGWLHLSTADEARKFGLAQDGRDGVELSELSFGALRDGIVERGIGVAQMDPYIYLSTLNENDNNAQGTLMGALKDLAQETQIAIALVHHAKKPSANDRGGPSSADIRGAGAIVNSARYGRVVNTMTAVEAEKLNVPDEDRWAYFRTTSVKANYAPGSRGGKWFKLHGVRLPNGDGDEDGDSVGVVTKWTPPDPMKQAGVTVSTLQAVQSALTQALSTGNPYMDDPKVKTRPWIGELVAEKANIVLDEAGRATVKGFVKTWLKSGALVREQWFDDLNGRQNRWIIRSGA